MGIEKEIELPTMAVANYHRIDGIPEITWDKYGQGKMLLAVSQYISYEARQKGAKPLSKCYKSLKLDKDLTGILRFVVYKAILPSVPEFESSTPAQDKELGSMLRLLHFLNERELALLLMGMKDLLEAKNIDKEDYRDLYENYYKDDMLSTIL